jgi:hypothetical protein
LNRWSFMRQSYTKTVEGNIYLVTGQHLYLDLMLINSQAFVQNLVCSTRQVVEIEPRLFACRPSSFLKADYAHRDVLDTRLQPRPKKSPSMRCTGMSRTDPQLHVHIRTSNQSRKGQYLTFRTSSGGCHRAHPYTQVLAHLR